MLQGSNHWKSVVLMDPDYNITKLNFDRFTEGFIPRLLFVRKKFSSEVNKAYLHRFYKKKRMITDKDITSDDLDKMLGNHLFKFFYKVLQQYSRGSNQLNHDNLVYLGLEDKAHSENRKTLPRESNMEEKSSTTYKFNCTELLEVYYAVLEQNSPNFVYEYLQFFMIGAQGDLNPFSMLKEIYSKSVGGVEDLRLLTKFYTQTSKESRAGILKTYDENIYKLKSFLAHRLAFTEKETAIQATVLNSLRTNHSMPEVSSQFRKMSDFGKLAVKLKLNEVVLPTLALKVAANCRNVVDLLAADLKQDRRRVAEVLMDSQLIKDSGLGQFIRHLVDN
jgi:hypothetical protein